MVRGVRTAMLIVVMIIIVPGCTTFSKKTPTAEKPVVHTKPGKPVSKLKVEQLPSSVRREWKDRVDRVERLSAKFKIKHRPEIESFQVERGYIDGVDYPVPVVRLRFTDKAFFDFDKDTIRQDSYEIVHLIAETMKKDMPDTKILLLGHTDSIGSRSYNKDLSKRRAVNVLKELNRRGVKVSQMSTVAIGEMQPIHSNKTEAGRAKNRRVEFVISSNDKANLHLVTEADFCNTCIDDHSKNRKVSTEMAKQDIDQLEVVQITDEHKVVVVEDSLATAKKKKVDTYLIKRKQIEAY